MDELDLFRRFRSGVAAPSEDARRQAFERLAQAMGDEARPTATANDEKTRLAGVLRLIRTRPRSSALALATLVAVAAAALFISAPWSNSPGFLERAEAALTPPAGTVLHEEIDLTSTWTRPNCRVTGTQAEVWIDTTPPHSYRVVLNDLPPDAAKADPRARACSSGRTSELGGTYSSSLTLRFVPPNRLTPYYLPIRFDLDPAARLRHAISAGMAHDEGKTQFDGRTVERIRLDPCPPIRIRIPTCLPERVIAYVDPETFYPVATDATMSMVEVAGGPGGSSYRHVRVRDFSRFQTFEYVPRTDANLALSDIRAQHPNATGP
jgi:hypothetical protein